VKSLVSRWRTRLAGESGYILIVVMLVLVVVGMMASTLIAAVAVNQQHVGRDKAYTQSLGVAEAGLNQYLWMLASGVSCQDNDFMIAGNTGPDPHKQTVTLSDADSAVKGTYTMEVTPPSANDARISIAVTGRAEDPVDTPRTITATMGRPSFSEYVLLVDEAVYVGGPIDRQWWGRTHSNTQIRMETANINDFITCSNNTYGGQPGVYSTTSAITSHANSLRFWNCQNVADVDFSTVTADFATYRDMASGDYEMAYVTPSPSTAAHGWYIKLLPGKMFQVARVTAELEQYNYVSGLNRGGYLTYGALSTAKPYPANGVIFVNDNVWVEGTGLTGRITIAASGQFNGNGKTASINVVGDLTYAVKDGTVKVGLIAQENVKIPMYAPMGKAGTMGTNWTSNVGTVDMEIDAALIAQTGKEFVNFNGTSGPRRGMLTIYGSVSSYLTPYRASIASNDVDYGGFGRGANTYDRFLLNEPPPSFPTVGSYQILEWQELPNTMQVETGS
jgi:type II secretory pathway pseudopilin PulG